MNLQSLDIQIPVDSVALNGMLQVPEGAKGIVLFVHGSGSGRFSPRNQYVARVLADANIATLLFDLLTPDEERVDALTREYRFNIELLTSRLVAVSHWVLVDPMLCGLKMGYFGASTGGAAALKAAAILQGDIKAVVSRGGRPDLAGESLSRVIAPTLLIVGENDAPVIQLNQQAMEKMHGIKRLAIIPGATHLFEEAGALERVASLASGWFVKYLSLS